MSQTLLKLLREGELFRQSEGGDVYVVTYHPPLGQKGDVQAKVTHKAGLFGGRYITDSAKLPDKPITFPPDIYVTSVT